MSGGRGLGHVADRDDAAKALRSGVYGIFVPNVRCAGSVEQCGGLGVSADFLSCDGRLAGDACRNDAGHSVRRALRRNDAWRVHDLRVLGECGCHGVR